MDFGAKMETGAFSIGFSFLFPVGLGSTVVVGRESSGDASIAERRGSGSAPEGHLGLRGPHFLSRRHLWVPLGPLVAVASSGIQGTPDD